MSPAPTSAVKRKDPRRPIFIAGVLLLVVSAVLYAVDVSRALSPWFLLAGVVLVLLYFLLRRVAATPATKRAESTLFRDSTQLGDPPDDRR